MAVVWRVIGLTFCLGVSWSTAASAQRDSTKPASTGGVYTAAQGDRGLDVYKRLCSRCHTVLDHSGPDFKLAWHGQTVRSLFDYLRGTMPDDNPGELTEQQYLDVTAYLLRLNGMPAGDTPLVADSTALKKLMIDIKSPGGAGNPGERLPEAWFRRLPR